MVDDSAQSDVPPLAMWLSRVHDGDLASAVEDAASNSRHLFARMVTGADEIGAEPADFADHAGLAWDVAGDSALSRDWWRDLFDAAGYRVNNEPAERPRHPLTLYRGATPEGRAGRSWADSRDAAVNFASGWMVQRDLGLVWRAVVEPERLLARLDYTPRYTFSEYVVDTDGLDVVPDGLWCRCPVDLAPFSGTVEEARLALDRHELVWCPRR